MTILRLIDLLPFRKLVVLNRCFAVSRFLYRATAMKSPKPDDCREKTVGRMVFQLGNDLGVIGARTPAAPYAFCNACLSGRQKGVLMNATRATSLTKRVNQLTYLPSISRKAGI